jgi:uncharacterized membrane protein
MLRNPDIGFWYSRKQALLLVAGLFLLVRLFGSLTPPFQSPDEFNHVKRAYLLSRAVLVVGNRGAQTGGEIDDGLLDYMDCFQEIPFNYGAKIERSTTRACDEIHYAGRRSFSDLSNTAMYFPFLYAPQALALFIGERSGLSVGKSYYLARLFSSCAVLALLMWALIVYPVPPAVLALFLLPMCLFQLSSASLDAITFAATVLAASLFLRGYHRGSPFSSCLHGALAACLFLLGTSRIIYIVLSPLLLVLYRVRKSRAYFVSFLAVLGLSLMWIGIAMTTVRGKGAIIQEMSSADIVKYYLTHPGAFSGVVLRTLTDGDILNGYWRMFVGILGWLDTPIGSVAYVVFAIELVAIVVASSSVTSLQSLNSGHLALACAASAAMALLLLVALSAWTIHPATVIRGIQGRYFYPIAVLFLFSGWASLRSRTGVVLSWGILVIMALSSVELAAPRLVGRYYSH